MPEGTTFAFVAFAAGLGVFHTLIGPDHYLPFVMIARARNWSLWRTGVLTCICGLGHVLSSVALGFLGITAVVAMEKIAYLEGARGSLAAWMIIAIGLLYMVWGLRKAVRGKSHTHGHMHADGPAHRHEHAHFGGHTHVHAKGKSITPWVLFIVFVFGPCEVLIPTLMIPAAQHNYAAVALIATVFGIATIGTMLLMVILATHGLKLIRLGPMERYSHVIAGGVIAASGLAMKFLGL